MRIIVGLNDELKEMITAKDHEALFEVSEGLGFEVRLENKQVTVKCTLKDQRTMHVEYFRDIAIQAQKAWEYARHLAMKDFSKVA